MMTGILTGAAMFVAGVTLFWANRNANRPFVTWLAIVVGGPLIWATFTALMVGRCYGAMRVRLTPPAAPWDRSAHFLLARLLADHLRDDGDTVLRPADEQTIIRLLNERRELYAFGDSHPCTISTDAPKTRDT